MIFFIPQERYRAAPYNASQPNNPDEVPAGIPTVYQPQGGGGGGTYTGGIDDLITDYNTTTKERYFRNQPTPLVDDLYQSKLDKTFMGFPSYREQQLTGPDLGEYIGTDTDVPLELTTAGKIQSGLGNIKDTASGIMSNFKGFGPVSMALNAMDRFDTLSPADQQFIEMNMGYTGPTVFGENTSGLSKDPYGINTRSAFGNYADYVSDYNTDYTDEELEKMSKFRQQKIAYYKQKQQELKEIKERKKLEAQQEMEARERSQADRARAANPDVYARADAMGFTDGKGGGFGSKSTGTNEAFSNETGRGRTGYMYGGLADLVDIYD